MGDILVVGNHEGDLGAVFALDPVQNAALGGNDGGGDGLTGVCGGVAQDDGAAPQ